MRHIVKQTEHPDFQYWKAQQKANAPQNFNFGALTTEVKVKIVKQMLEEQGYLCAYTLLRIQDEHSCHIEHVQAQSTHPQFDLDSSNMLACVPSGKAGTPALGYGATYRGTQSVESPTIQNIESRLSYDVFGKINAKNSLDLAIKATIDALNLNQDDLVRLRQRAIETQGLGAQNSRTRLSRPRLNHLEARRLANSILQPNKQGKLTPFCIAIAQVALAYADRYESRRKNIQANQKH